MGCALDQIEIINKMEFTVVNVAKTPGEYSVNMYRL